MNTQKVNEFLSELSRCEPSLFNDHLPVEQHTYNGITGAQGADYYFKVLGRMYSDFVNELQGLILTQESNKIGMVANSLYSRIVEIENTFFDVPTDMSIMALQKDISARKGKASPEMVNELQTWQFMSSMAKTQRYYTGQVKTYLESILDPQPVTAEPQQQTIAPQPAIVSEPVPQEKYVYGLSGVMELLNCRKNKASDTVNNPKYKDAIHKDGRKYIVDAEKLLELMRLSNQPEERRPKRKNTQNNR